MSIFLERLDSLLPDATLENWLSIAIDTLNENWRTLEDQINQPVLPAHTSAEIISLAASAPDGALWYCTDSAPPTIVAKINGALTKLTTTAFP